MALGTCVRTVSWEMCSSVGELRSGVRHELDGVPRVAEDGPRFGGSAFTFL